MNQELHTCVSMQILTNMSQLADHDSYGPSHLLKSIFFKKVLKPFSPNVGRVAQRKKKFNQFYCLIMILGYKRDSKLPKVKKNLKPSWR